MLSFPSSPLPLTHSPSLRVFFTSHAQQPNSSTTPSPTVLRCSKAPQSVKPSGAMGQDETPPQDPGHGDTGASSIHFLRKQLKMKRPIPINPMGLIPTPAARPEKCGAVIAGKCRAVIAGKLLFWPKGKKRKEKKKGNKPYKLQAKP